MTVTVVTELHWDYEEGHRYELYYGVFLNEASALRSLNEENLNWLRFKENNNGDEDFKGQGLPVFHIFNVEAS